MKSFKLFSFLSSKKIKNHTNLEKVVNALKQVKEILKDVIEEGDEEVM